MSIFVKEGSMKQLYFKDNVFLPKGEISEEFVEIKESIPYGLQSQYQQKVSNALVYSGKTVVKVKPEAFDVDIWLLSQVVKGITYLDDGEPQEYRAKSQAMLEKDLKEVFITQFVTNLITEVKDYYGIQEKEEEKKEEGEQGLGE